MSEILIKGMEMPKTCRRCLEMEIPVRCRVKEQEPVTAVMSGYDRPNDCPLVELPPHGRLGDLDSFKESTKDVRLERPIKNNGTEIIEIGELFAEFINNVPTIIEASKERE